MAASNSGPPPALESAKDIYDHVWAAGPFTHFHMVRYLMNKYKTHILGDQYSQLPEDEDVYDKIIRDFLRTPGILNDAIIAREMKKDRLHDADGLRPVWAENTGTCTSFVVRVVLSLHQARPDHFNFTFYDMIGHRLARCKRTKIVIDSSARNVKTLQDNGQPVGFGNHTLVCENGKLKAQKKDEVRERSLDQILAVAAAAKLCSFAPKRTLLTRRSLC
jgi:hypothetical protein